MIPEGSLCFVDTETLGLEARRHVVWEFAGTRAIPVEDGSGYEVEDLDLLIEVTPDELRIADSTALRMTGFYDRYDTERAAVLKWEAARQIAKFTAGCHIVAAVPSFDDLRLDDLLRGSGYAPAWHYHLIDTEAVASGYLRGLYDACREMQALGTKWGQDVEAAVKIAMPSWNSDALSNAIGVPSSRFNRHTARGDVDWSIAIFEKVYGVTIR